MHNSFETIIIAAALLLLLSVLMSQATTRFGIPALLVFLGIGMLAGSDGIGGIYFDNAYYAQSFGTIALIYILFSGGLDTEFSSVKPLFKQGIALATIGVFIVCVSVAAFAVFAFHVSWFEGLLLGAIVSSTDAAAVFSILGGQKIGLPDSIRPLLELESGSNDPMAVLLTVGILELQMHPTASLGRFALDIVLQLVLGAGLGYAAGKSGGHILKKMNLSFEGLYPVFTMAFILLVYGLTQKIGGNGFLAVYLTGLILGRENFQQKKSILLFHDGLAWLMQIAMFLVLGLLVFPSRLWPVAGTGILVSLFLIFVARPLAVFISLANTDLPARQKAMISWVGLRGSVPIILATYPLVAGFEKADEIFHLVFFIVITSVLVQGTSIGWVARLLKVQKA